MDLGLQGKRALVTGSTAGIGLAAACALAAEGAEVTLNGRTEARVRAAVEVVSRELPAARVHGFAADLSSAAGCEAIIAHVPELDVLVNNMGIFEPRPFAEITDADWLRFFETNVLSGIRLARHYVSGMRARDWGRIVFVSSESALQIPAEMIHYGVTKTAQLAVARGLAETLQGTGVTVNSVLPGPTASEGVGAFVAQLAEARGVNAETVEREFFATARPRLSYSALRHASRGRRHDCIRVQRASVGDDRGRPARGRRSRPRDRLGRGLTSGSSRQRAANRRLASALGRRGLAWAQGGR